MPDRPGLLRGDLSPRIQLSATTATSLLKLASPCKHILDIISLSPPAEMGRINARRIVAGMQRVELEIQVAIGGYAQGYPVGEFPFSQNLKDTVSLGVLPRRPNPASIRPGRFIDLAPKAIEG